MPSVDHGLKGRHYWRSLDDLEQTPGYQQFAAREFSYLDQLPATSRRQFLRLMGASLALGGLTGCRWPKETIVPYAKRPSDRLPGAPIYFATACERGGYATGLLAKSYDGRPIKLEGNDQHPSSRGATDAFAQADILDLYDPDRSMQPAKRGQGGLQDATWEDCLAEVRAALTKSREARGAGLLVVSAATSSPTLASLRRKLSAVCPDSKWLEYEPISRDNERSGLKLAFGKAMRPQWKLADADIVVSFDCDFLYSHPAAVAHMRAHADRRGRVDSDSRMNRLYVLESMLSVTGTNADERFAVRSSDVAVLLCQLGAALVELGVKLPEAASAKLKGFDTGALKPKFIAGIAKDLAEHRGHGLILIGPRQPAEAHALTALLNVGLENHGKTIVYAAEPAAELPGHAVAVQELANALRDASTPKTVLFVNSNPAYTAPADLEIDKLLAKHTTIHLGLYRDETARLCSWHIPAAHYLESWGDARAWDGTVSIVQPLIEPLFGGQTAVDLVALALGEAATSFELVRRTFKEQFAKGAEVEGAWKRALHDGLIAESAFAPETPQPAAIDWAAVLGEIQGRFSPPKKGEFELVFAPDHKVYDGRYANNGWLQELPDPVTKLVWDNAALMSPSDARSLGVKRDSLVQISLGDRKLTLPVCVVPGHASGSLTLPLGYGRSAAGAVAEGAGFNTYLLRGSKAWDIAHGATVRATGGSYALATTQDHHAMTSIVGTDEMTARAPTLVREASLEHFKAHPDFVAHVVHRLPLIQLFGDAPESAAHAWGMAIDLNKCTGCSACVVACQSENNIPVVGKAEVQLGREMHWIRIDRYFSGDPFDADAVRVAHQPVACQQCENAPCEQVCPVAATVHDADGLNVMVYNRCIGTRYCSNNCPYKVRRFNWFYNHYGPRHPRSRDGLTVFQTFDIKNTPSMLPQTKLTDIEKMRFNPDVTVRSRGVMEKCTFCVQRINAVKIVSKNEQRVIADGEVVTACQQACPAEAITFGNLRDAKAAVTQQHAHPRAYAMLEELNVRPRNLFLAKITNPAAGSAAAPAGGGHGHG